MPKTLFGIGVYNFKKKGVIKWKKYGKTFLDMNGLYQVSNLGRVKSLNYLGHGKEMLKKPSLPKKTVMHPSQYYQVGLYKQGKCKTHKVHRLVAEAFIPNPNNLPQVNHIDCNPFNNCANNLEWCTAKYNANHKRNNRKPLGE